MRSVDFIFTLILTVVTLASGAPVAPDAGIQGVDNGSCAWLGDQLRTPLSTSDASSKSFRLKGSTLDSKEETTRSTLLTGRDTAGLSHLVPRVGPSRFTGVLTIHGEVKWLELDPGIWQLEWHDRSSRLARWRGSGAFVLLILLDSPQTSLTLSIM